MSLHRIDIRTELVTSILESDSNGTEVLILGIPVYSSLNALVACNCI